MRQVASRSRSFPRESTSSLRKLCPEMPLDGLDRHDELVGDLAVREAARGQQGHLALALGERVDAGDGRAPRAGAGGLGFVLRARHERVRAAALCEVEAEAQRLAGVAATSGAAQGRAELDEPARPLERGL